MRQRGLEIVSCPSCGRAQVDVYKLADEVTAGLTGLEVPLRVAVMGCVVNGPGEAREADLGVASGNGKGQIFVKGKVIATVPESKIVETLIDEAMRLAEQALEDGAQEAPGQPIVTASHVNAGQVEFQWTYANSASGDTFRWQEMTGGTGERAGIVTKPDLLLAVAKGQSACITVTVRSADGEASRPSSPVCSPK